MFRFEKNKTCVFSIEKCEHYSDQFILTEVVNLGYREIERLHSNRFFSCLRCDILRAIAMRSAFTPDCGYDNSTILLVGDVYCPNTKCSVKLCLHKKTLQSLGRSDYQCPHCASVCQLRNISFHEQKDSFFLSFGRGVYTFEEKSKSIQDVIGDVYCPGEYCLNRENCESLIGYVTTPRSIYGCGNCECCLVFHKVPFMLQKST